MATATATATEPTIEQRLAALEAAVAAIHAHLTTLARPDEPARVVAPAPDGPPAAEAVPPVDASGRAESHSNGESPVAVAGDAAPATPGPTVIEPYTSPPIPRAKMDDQGHLILPTPAEAAAKAEAIRAMLKRLEAIESDPGEDDAEFFRAIDSHRPHRPLFEGLY